jgi:hypothetical protein
MVGANFATVAAVVTILRSKKGIIAVGNAQVSTAQSKFGGASALFDGTGDYLFVASNSDFGFGTGDFTLEGWFRFTNFTNGPALFDLRASGGTEVKPVVYCGSDGVIYYYVNGATAITGNTLSANTWYHIALSRSSGVTKLFRDGTQIGSNYTDTNNYPATVVSIGIASWNTSFNALNGYVDEVRISNSARYTAAFTPSTVPFVNDDNTLLLIHANGTNATTFFEDDNGATTTRTAKTFTAVGNAQLSTAQEKFGQSSMLFDGTGDHFISSASNDFTFTGNFTVELWVRLASTGAIRVPIGNRSSGTGLGIWWVEVGTDQAGYSAWQNTAGTSYYPTYTGTISANTWTHLAVVRNGTTLTMYKDGVGGTAVTGVTGTFGGNGAIYIGGIAASYNWDGYIDEVRISKVARYAANFTAPATTFENDANTVLLVHADGADASLIVTDDVSGRSPHGLSQQNTAAISTTQSYFGGSSLSLNGSSSVNTPSSFAFGTTDFTVEYWIRPTSLSSYDIHWDLRGGNTSQISPIVYTLNGTLTMDVGATTRITGSTLSTNTWYHIALSRSGSSTKLFVNGTQTGSTYTDTNNYLAATPLYIGQSSGSGVDGFMDEFRISNSARYTANFTPSTTPFVNDANTLLLCHFDGTNSSTVFRDDNGTRRQQGVISNGSAAVSTTQSKFGGSSLYVNGTNQFLTSPDASNTAFTTEDFTVEAWLYPISSTGNFVTNLQNGTNNGWQVSHWSTGRILFCNNTSAGTPGIDVRFSSDNAFTLNAWNHIAVCRTGTTLTMYSNGNRVYSASNLPATLKASNAGLRIGHSNGIADGLWQDAGAYSNSYSNEIRISNIVRYTGTTYTIPTAPFQNDANTLLLLHNNGTNGSTVFFDDNGIAPYTPT